MSELLIFKQLVAGGMTPIAACAMGGNMYCESTMQSNIAQRGMTSLSDAEYTTAADAGQIDFVHDAVGYGLCQWTYYTRKQNLLNYARACGVSVGDETMQVKFCLKELQTEYATLWAILQSAMDLYSATAKICTEFERPAVNNIKDRVSAANAFYMQYGGILEDMITETADDTVNPLTPIDDISSSEKEVCWPPRVLCEGMEGSDVSAAQALLLARGEDVEITGIFDTQFKNRVMVWQNYNGLAADGIIGNMTWAALLCRK